MTAHKNSLPKSVQISETLIREIAAGKLADGERLPPERDMADMFSVAVGTVRKALAILEKKKLVERVQGSGNYIRARPDIESVYSFFRLELITGGGLPTARLLNVRNMVIPKTIPSIGDGKKGHRIRRIRYIDQLPAALEEIWLDGRFIDEIRYDDLNESLYYFYKESLGLVISHIQDQVGVSVIPSWLTGSDLEQFNLNPQDSCGFIERRGWDQHGEIAEFSRTWFDHNVARYTIRLQ